jgi:hypothetical protein
MNMGAQGPGGYGAPQGGGYPQGPQRGVQGPVNTNLPVILGVVEVILCCNPLFGIAGIVLGLIASGDLKNGNAQEARNKVNIAYVIVGVGALFGLFFVVLFGLPLMLGIVAALVGSAQGQGR